MRLDGISDIGRRDAELRHLVRSQPDAHRIILRAEYRRIAHALDALQFIQHIERAVIAQIQRVEGAVRGVQHGHQQQIVGALLDHQPVAADVIRQAWQRGVDAITEIESRLIGIGTDFKRGRDGQRAAGIGAGTEVKQPLNAAELFLDWGSNRF